MRRARHPPRGRARLRGPTPSSRSARSSRATTRCIERPPRATTSRRSCWSTRTPRSSTRDFCAKVREALSDPEVGVVGCVGRGRRAQHRLVGGVRGAGLLRPPLRGARRRRPAGLLVGLGRRAAVRAHRRGRHAGRLPARALALGRAQRPLRRVARACCTATTSTSASRCARRGSKVMTADFRAIHHHSLDLVSDPETWIEAHMKIAEKWDGRMPGVGTGRGQLEAARAARRGRARRRAGGRPTRSGCETRGAQSRELERALGEAREQHLVADDRAAAPARRAARRARDDRLRLPRSPRRSPTALRRARHPAAPPSPDSEIYAFAAAGADLRAATTCCSTRRRRTTTSRRSCSCTRTPRSPIPTSARRSGRRSRIPDVGAGGLRSAPPACAHRVVGGRGACRRRWCTATASTAAASSPAFAWTEPQPAPGEVDVRRRLPAGALAWAVRNVRFDESAAARPRIRPRLLPPGPRGRAQGR